MKVIIAATALSLCLVIFSLGKDSFWGLGDDGKIAISFLDYRSGASSRVLDVTLIMGDSLLIGSLKEPIGNINDQPLKLAGKNGTFKGRLSIDWTDDKKPLKLSGQLILFGNSYRLDETIHYKEMTGL